VGEAAVRGRPLLLMGQIALATGHFRAALTHLEEAEPLLRSRRDFVGESMLGNLRAGAHAMLGDFVRAEQETVRATALAEQGDALARIDARLARAMVVREQGDWRLGIRYASECMDQAEEIGSLSCAAMASLALGGSQLGLGEEDAARATLERGLDLSVQSHLVSQRLTATAMLSEIAGLSGALDLAWPGWQGALEGFEGLGDGFSMADVRLGRSEALAMGPHPDPAAALPDLDAAVATLEALEARPRLARALRIRARVLQRLGRDAEAEASLGRAADLAERMGLQDGPWPRSVAGLGAS
jgi:tetratricopeptide (TPR) repeat protein